MKRSITVLGIAVLAFWFGAGALLAQSTGSVEGTVSDPAAAVVSNARLALTNTSTGVQRSAVSQSSGAYRFDYLSPGTYKLQADATGFKATLVDGVVVEVGKTTAVNLHLQVGGVAEQVTVTAEPPLVNLVDGQVSTNVSQTYVRQLPNQSRDALAFADMAPGVTVNLQAAAGAASGLTITGGTTISVNGSRDGRSNYYLDGSDNAGSFRNSALQFPNPDAVQEVQVTTSNSSAEYGRQLGGVVNVVTKSGTNTFHGDGFYFFRNKYLNANDAGYNAYGQARPNDYFREWGGTLGGPIIKNKTFFFVSYQRYTNHDQQLQNSVIAPTPAMLNGDFSGLLNPSGASGLGPTQLYDPNDPNYGNPSLQTPIPNNRLDLYKSPYTGAPLLDPVGLKVAQLLPTVSNYGDKFIWAYADPQTNNELLTKIDHHFNSAHGVSVSFLRTWGNVTWPAMDFQISNVPNWGPEKDTDTQNTLVVRHTWTVTPRVLIESSFNMAIFNAYRNQTQHKNLTDFGAQNMPESAVGARKYLPNMFVGTPWGSGGMIAGQGYLSTFDQHNYRFGSTVSWLHGEHQVKVGFQAQHDAVIQINDQDNATLTFGGCYSTGLLNNAAGNPCPNDSGPGVADLMMGVAASYGGNPGWNQQGILNYDVNNWNYYFFAQDEWKIRKNLSITPGLRYEFYQPTHEKNNRIDSFVAGFHSTLYPNAPLGMAFAGDRGIPKGFYNPDYSNIAPRLGVAWDPKGSGRTSIRGGIGRYFSANPKQLTMLNSEQSPWYPIAGCTQTVISNPWLRCQLPSFSTPPTPFSTSPNGLASLEWAPLEPLIAITGYPSSFKTPYSDQWSVTFEHQFGGNIVVYTGYVANRSHRLNENIPINYSRYINDPITGNPPDATPQNMIDRRPYSSGAYAGTGSGIYDNGLILQEDAARSNYNGLQSGVEMRSIHGLELRANYAYNRGTTNATSGDITDNGISNLNPADPFTGNWQYLVRHSFKAFYLYELPFFSSRDTWLKRLAGGWRLSGDVHAYSGTPANVILNSDWNFDSMGGDRPDLNGPIHYTSRPVGPSIRQWINLGTGPGGNGQSGTDNSGNLVSVRGPFSPPGGATNHNAFGTTPFNAALTPSTWNMDTSLAKDFHFTNEQYLEVRLEGYNIFNHPRWGCLNLNYTDIQFGQLTCESGHRSVQVGVKYYF